MSENIKREPPNDSLQCLKEIWIAQTEQKGILQEHGRRLDAIDEHLKKHDACLKPFQLSWCAGRLIWCAVIKSSWFGRAVVLLILSILGASQFLQALVNLRII